MPKCPRCRETLVERFWKYWAKFKRDKSISCPGCGSRMEVLNKEMQTSLEIDCCPQCFALWLDAGEDQALHEFFRTTYAQADQAVVPHGPRAFTKEDFEILAKAALDHEQAIARYNRIAEMATELSKPLPLHRRLRAIGFPY